MKLPILAAVLLFSGSVAFAQNEKENTRVKAGELKLKTVPRKVTSTPTTTNDAPAPTVYTNIEGTVHVSTECGAYIEVNANGVPMKYYPLNLPSEFNEDGAEIVFDYVEETPKFPANCEYSKAITTNNVKLQELR